MEEPTGEAAVRMAQVLGTLQPHGRGGPPSAALQARKGK